MNLAGVVEVLDINGRPAVLQEWLTGLFMRRLAARSPRTRVLGAAGDNGRRRASTPRTAWA